MPFYGLPIFHCLNTINNRKRGMRYIIHLRARKEGWENQTEGDMKARAYDVVMNGIELGGGENEFIREKCKSVCLMYLD